MPITIGLTEAKAKFSQITREANENNRVITVYKNNRPWVDIVPRATRSKQGTNPTSQQDYLDAALGTMDEYHDMFQALA